MKFKHLTVILGILGVIFFAQINSYAQKPQVPTDEQVKQLEGTVEVSFKIDAAGKLEVISINATSPQLADYVISKLNKIKLDKGDPQIGQVVKYRFVFKKQV